MTDTWSEVDRITLASGTSMELEIEDPLSLIAGYAFATHEPDLSLWSTQHYGEDPPTERCRWGYRTYDCIPASDGPGLVGADLTVAAGLNGRMNVDRVGALQAIASEVKTAIAHLDHSPPFWELDRDDIHEPQEEGTPGWWLARAWYVLMRQPDIDVAITHKTLHHKRPQLFPLLDGKTIEELPRREAWRTIHDDLTSQAGKWAQLEADFARLVDRGAGDVPLFRLRLHDILLWLTAAGQAAAARTACDRWREQSQ